MKETDNIFLVNDKDELERVPYRNYENEGRLHELVDRYPDLIAGEQINPDDPPRWVVVKREAGVPDSETGNDRWSLDNLLLDQHGRPTLVEVKRSSDSRIRREVVGQMLDYAANAQKYWPTEKIKSWLASRFGGLDEMNEHLKDFLGLDTSPDSDQELQYFWQNVEVNLRKGEVRLLFVADKIPPELKRIIEYMNEQMQRVEVLGVEIRQYQGRSIKALVPRLIGQTEFARQIKETRKSTRFTTEEEFLASCPDNSRPFFKRLLAGAQKSDYTIYWGTKGFSIRAQMPNKKWESLHYGYPPNLDGNPFPVFQVYLSIFKDPKTREIARNAYKEHMPFRLRGNYTLEITLDEDGLRHAESGLDGVLEVTSRIVEGSFLPLHNNT